MNPVNPVQSSSASPTRRKFIQAVGATAVAGAAVSLANPAESKAAGSSASTGATPAHSGHGKSILATYPIPSGIPTNDAFTVRARVRGGSWQKVDVYQANIMVIDPKSGKSSTPKSSMAYFDFTGTVEVSVTWTGGHIREAAVRPLSYGMKPIVRGRREMIFTLDRPRNLSIEVNGDRINNLQLFAGAINQNPPKADDPDVIYFGPGVHTADGNNVAIGSGKTLYLAGGAVLKASVSTNKASDVKILGPGILYSMTKGIDSNIAYSKNVVIDGVKCLGVKINIAQSEDVTIRNLKSISAVQWGDGLDFYSSKNALAEGLFMRTSDDCVAVYNHRWDYYGDSENITIRNSSLWADVAHPINVGTHGNSDNNEVIDKLTISNIDILDHREPQVDYQGAIALNPGDGNLIKNARIEDVRVEDIRWGQLINMRVMYNKKYNTSIGRGIDTVYIKNLSYNGNRAAMGIMTGYDADHAIKNVTFENLTINGVPILDKGHASWYVTTDYVPIYANEHVSNVTFVEPTTPVSGAPTITSRTTATATVGSLFRYQIAASGKPYVFAAASLPEGLVVNNRTGVISGVPTEAGTYTITVSATNKAGAGSTAVTLTVK